MPTNDNTHPGMLFANGEPIVEIKDVDFTEAPKEDPAKEDKYAPYFNNSPEMTFRGEVHLSKKEKRKLNKVYKKTIGKLKMFKTIGKLKMLKRTKTKWVPSFISDDKPMHKREINKKLKQHNKFLTNGKGKAANFSNAFLYDINLSGTNLRGACFRGALLKNVKFIGTDLTAADFTGADFVSTDLSNAILCGAYLKGVTVDSIYINENTKISVPLYCPSSGSFIGWKKALYHDVKTTCIVRLLIPEDAKRSSAFDKKCRCDKAVILGAYDYVTGHPLEESTLIRSLFDPEFAYHIGDTITIPNFDDNRWEECSSGFHFFIDEESAKNF